MVPHETLFGLATSDTVTTTWTPSPPSSQASDSVFVDLLTYQDLEALKARQAPAAAQNAGRGGLPPSGSNKRYLILTYAGVDWVRRCGLGAILGEGFGLNALRCTAPPLHLTVCSGV